MRHRTFKCEGSNGLRGSSKRTGALVVSDDALLNKAMVKRMAAWTGCAPGVFCSRPCLRLVLLDNQGDEQIGVPDAEHSAQDCKRLAD